MINSLILCRTLEYVTNYTLFTTFCILIRGFEALGASAFSTASYVFVVNTFPQNIGSVLGILETFVGLGMSTGPALGGVLYSIVRRLQHAVFRSRSHYDSLCSAEYLVITRG
jgi:MFS family permease